MKKIYNLLFIIVVISFLSCERELETEGISDIVYYPSITLNGEEYVSIVVGENYEDEGAVAISNEQEIDVQVSNNVDNSKVGLYTITYSAENEAGYAATATRYVVVTEEDVSSVNLAGNYKGGRDDIQITVEKLADGLYSTGNALGDGNNLAITFLHVAGNELFIPVQDSKFGRVQGSQAVGENLDKITPTGFTWGIDLLDPPNDVLFFGGLEFTKL